MRDNGKWSNELMDIEDEFEKEVREELRKRFERRVQKKLDEKERSMQEVERLKKKDQSNST